MARLITQVVPALAAMALIGATAAILHSAQERVRADPRIPPPGQPWPRQGSVSAAGLVEAAGEQVSIGAEVSGTITRVAVVPGQAVRRGELLFSQDPRLADAHVALARSQVQAAEAALAQARSLIPGLSAAVDTAVASVAEASAAAADTADLLRSGEGVPAGLSISRREITSRRNNNSVAQARLDEAIGRLAQARAALAQYRNGDTEGPTVLSAEAAVTQAQANLAQAETVRDMLTVRAPFDGTVLQVDIREGEYARMGGPPALIFGRLDQLQFRADIDAADIPRFDPQARAVAVPPGDPSRRVALHLLRVEPLVVPKVALTGAGQDRVDTRVLRVVYRIEGSAQGLYPGQQLNLFLRQTGEIPTAEK
jgi:multidrug resistance efflux pump